MVNDGFHVDPVNFKQGTILTGVVLTAYIPGAIVSANLATFSFNNYYYFMDLRYLHLGIAATLLVLMLSACAMTIPVQEMSNARQALQAAEEVEAERYAPMPMARAKQLLSQATGYLHDGNYGLAREHAVEARVVAYKARQKALSESRLTQ